MATDKLRFSGVLVKPIDLSKAKPHWLNAVFALPPDADDRRVFAKEEFQLRFAEFDKQFGLNPAASDIDEQRFKAVFQWKYAISPTDSNWWKHAGEAMLGRHVRGFAIKLPDKKSHGRSEVWSPEKLAQLYADVNFEKKLTGESIRAICTRLPTNQRYKKRWAPDRKLGLRNAYMRAEKLRTS